MKIEEVLNQIISRVAEQRSQGKYPPGLEQELEYEFSTIMNHATRNQELDLERLFHLLHDRLGVIDHLAIMTVELEDRIRQLEQKVRIDDL